MSDTLDDDFARPFERESIKLMEDKLDVASSEKDDKDLGEIERHCEEMPEVQALYNLRHRARQLERELWEREEQIKEYIDKYGEEL
jgi:hypothetical protein